MEGMGPNPPGVVRHPLRSGSVPRLRQKALAIAGAPGPHPILAKNHKVRLLAHLSISRDAGKGCHRWPS